MYKQILEPNLNLKSTIGMCLAYVEDAFGTNHRSPSAQAEFNLLNSQGLIKTTDPQPTNVYYLMWFSSRSGLGHVAIAFFDTSNNLTIYDSDTQSGYYQPPRTPFKSIDELLSWQAVNGLVFEGWSVDLAGSQLAEIVSTPAQVLNEQQLTVAKALAQTGKAALYKTDKGAVIMAYVEQISNPVTLANIEKALPNTPITSVHGISLEVL